MRIGFVRICAVAYRIYRRRFGYLLEIYRQILGKVVSIDSEVHIHLIFADQWRADRRIRNRFCRCDSRLERIKETPRYASMLLAPLYRADLFLKCILRSGLRELSPRSYLQGLRA